MKHRYYFYWLLIVGVLPAVIIGLLAKKSGVLDWLLDSVEVVAVMLVVGGIFMLFCDKLFNKGSESTPLNEKRAFNIGLYQCISVIPGVSRSMATIVGGMTQGLTRKRAAEFSFFLAVPTMAGATLLDLLDLLKGDTTWATSHNITMLVLGCAVAFVVALLAMKWFVHHCRQHHNHLAAHRSLTCNGRLNMDFKEGEIIAIDKPYGMSSFGALAHIRFLCSKKQGSKVKMGHAGTLDPLATGVLVLCTGKKTKQIEQLQAHTKEYVAGVQLGATTASFDMEHEVDATYPTEHITRELVEQMLTRFVGEQQQVPPSFSACMVNGKRAYQLSRKGKEVELQPKTIQIDEIELLDFDAQTKQAHIRVVCGKGTYIRALARDIGSALGSGAYLTSLRRTRVGDIRVEECHDFDSFAEWLDQQQLANSHQ